MKKNIIRKKNKFLNISDIQSFLKNDNYKGDNNIFYLDNIFKTYVKLFIYSWITIFLDIIFKKIFSFINITSLYNSRGTKLCTLENNIL